MADENPKPMHDEGLRGFAERLDSEGVTSVIPVMDNFGLDHSAAKALWLANEGFNARFSFDGWRNRREKGIDGYGARNWLKRAYKLDDETADRIVAGFEEGNERALVDYIGFEKIARMRLTEGGQRELEKLGLISDGRESAK